MKGEKTPQQPQSADAKPPTAEEMQTAYRAHTLAQLLYGRVAATHPWIAPTVWVPELSAMHPGPAGFQGVPGVPDFQAGAGFPGYPGMTGPQAYPRATGLHAFQSAAPATMPWNTAAYAGCPVATGFVRHHWIW